MTSFYFETLNPPKEEGGGKEPFLGQRNQDVLLILLPYGKLFWKHMKRYRECLTKLAMLVQSLQIRPNSHYVHLLQPLLFIISATVTTGYVKIPSNFYHQLPIPQCPGPPRGVKFVCISPPGNRVINFPFIYQELLPKRKSFIGCDLWEEREKGLISREGKRRQRKGRESWSFCCPGQMEKAKFPGAFSPFPSPEDTFPPTPPPRAVP